MKKALVMFGMLLFAAGQSLAQGQWIDSILPPDHLLEVLPWMGDGGKVDSKGLFDFEDIRGAGQKDLILIYRQSVPVNELDKPHNQTLVVCFYDAVQKKYVKSFQDDGGIIQWVRLAKGPASKVPVLVLQRDDLKGNQALRGFAFLNGVLKQVLDASAPQILTTFTEGSQGTEILCSSKDAPKGKDDAQRVFAWDEGKAKFVEKKDSTAAGWTGSSLTVAAAPAAVSAQAPAAGSTPVVQAAVPAGAGKATHKAKNGWWDEPLDAQASLLKLKTELVPQLVKDKQVPVLGQKAKAFFEAVAASGIKGKDLASMRATYYSAVASATLDGGDAKGAAYYLKTALQLQADNPDGLAVKAKLK